MTTDTVSPRDQLFLDIFTTALEGGINYWAECEKYHWSTKVEGDLGTSILVDDVKGFYADIVDLYELTDPNDDDSGVKHRIDRMVVARGYKLATTTFRDKVYWSSGEKPPLVITEDSDWDYDAGDADVIVQLGLGLFDENGVTYG